MYRSTKQQQKELESIKLATAKQYALMRYFAKIERFLKLEKIDNVGFKISSLTEAEDWAHLAIMTNQYKGQEKVEIPYFVHVKIKKEDGKEKYYFKLEKITKATYKIHAEIYEIERLKEKVERKLKR